SSTSVSQPGPAPAALADPWVNVTVFEPATSRDAGKLNVASRGKPLRSAWRAMVESLLAGNDPVISAVLPLTATVGRLPCCIAVETVRYAVPLYVRSRSNATVHTPGFVCA